ncbi:MAG: hypothetical protein OXD01_04570 [Gammaproteobacteria bacterium]|nr:hypothetical protein [Gammaproteobacteria bacterium]
MLNHLSYSVAYTIGLISKLIMALFQDTLDADHNISLVQKGFLQSAISNCAASGLVFHRSMLRQFDAPCQDDEFLL